jgi:hypothetical protein
MLEPAHIVGISKTGYVPATPRCLEWLHGLQETSTTDASPDPDPQDPYRRPPGRRRSVRRDPRLPGVGVVLLVGFAERVGAAAARADAPPVGAP